MEREIILIDEEKCDGCGLCVPECPEGAIQIIDDKARLISDLFCDGLGACIGHCPQDAIKIEKREAEPYDERKVMQNIIKYGENTIIAHLKHLEDHGETEFLSLAKKVLKENNIDLPEEKMEVKMEQEGCGCQGSKTTSFKNKKDNNNIMEGTRPSQLTHWPIQMHLISPRAPHFTKSDFVLAADCVAFSYGDFHKEYLKDKTLAIACPKLDSGQDVYLEKLKVLIDESEINTLSVVIMQVPCCGGLLHLAKKAVEDSSRKVPIKLVVVGVQGDILHEEWA